MALKRRVEKSYSLQEMMEIISRDFIQNVSSRHYILTPTCFKGQKHDADRWLMCDSRAISENGGGTDELPSYFGHTIIEAVTKCFNDRKNWMYKDG